MTAKEKRIRAGLGFFACFWRDLGYGVHILMRNPGFAIMAIISLAFGIGATIGIFSIIDTVWLQPLPYTHEDRMVAVSEVRLDNPANTMNVRLSTFFGWREQCTSFEYLDLQFTLPLTLVGGEHPVGTVTRRVSDGYFNIFDGEASLGRLFLPEDFGPGRPPTLILSYNLWQNQFNSDPDVIGRKVNLETAVHTVIGVMSPDYKPLNRDDIDLWLPLDVNENMISGNFYQVIGLLKNGTDLPTAQAEIDVVASRLADKYPQLKGVGARIQPLQDYLYSGWSRWFLRFFIAVAFVLLIACANVANLLLARASSRNKEMAVRASVGADRPRLIRQVLTEGFLLSILSTVLGLFLAFLAVKLLININPDAIPRSNEIGLNLHILGFAVLLAFLCTLLFSLPPALGSSKPDLTESLKDSGYRSASRFGGRRVHGVLVVLEIALSLVLLIGASLVMYNMWRVMRIDAGFNTDNLITMGIRLPMSEYMDNVQVAWLREKPRAKLVRQQIQEELQALPGVRSVAIAAVRPLSGCWQRFVGIGSQKPPEPGSSSPVVCLLPVSPEYFETLQIPLIRGRGFTEQDSESSQPVAVINESMVRRYFNDEDPIGKMLNLGQPNRSPLGPQFKTLPTDEPPLQIIGIAADVRQYLRQPPIPAVYMQYSQLPEMFSALAFGTRSMKTFVVRTEVKPGSLKTAMREIASDVAGDAMVMNAETGDEMKRQYVQGSRMYGWLLTIFAGVAITLAIVGVFGVMSYAVTQRTREIGIRMAIGARAHTVVRLIMRQGLLMILLGLIIGLAGAFGLTRYLRGLLFEVKPTDPLTFLLASIGLFIVALVACFIPAYRAAKVDPVTTLRHE
jgi:putative ABC transport system permease protein